MHIKFLKHSTGSGANCINYLINSHDYLGRPRKSVEVIRGNTISTAHLIDSLSAVHRYTSAVIAWAPSDQPTDAEIEQVLDDFEATAFAGLQPYQYAWLVVVHEGSSARKHLHIIVPRVELVTGKALNIAPPGWEKLFDPLCDAWNHQLGWARPDDPKRARVIKPRRGALTNRSYGFSTIHETDTRNASLNTIYLKVALIFRPDKKAVLVDALMHQARQGRIRARKHISWILSEIGTVSNLPNRDLSLQIKHFAGPFKIDAKTVNEIVQIGIESANSIGETLQEPHQRSPPDFRLAATAREKLQRQIAERIKWNRQQYDASTNFEILDPASTPLVQGARRAMAPLPNRPVNKNLAGENFHSSTDTFLPKALKDSENERDRKFIIEDIYRHVDLSNTTSAVVRTSIGSSVERSKRTTDLLHKVYLRVIEPSGEFDAAYDRINRKIARLSKINRAKINHPRK